MAPEQFRRDRPVDHRSDIYALGVVLYELLTGELPLGRFSPPSLAANCTAHLDEVVLRCLEANPERRFQQVRELEAGLAGAPLPALPAAAERKPGATLDPASELQRVHRLLDATESGASWGFGMQILSVLTLGISSIWRAESLLEKHAAENRLALDSSEFDERQQRYAEGLGRETEAGVRRRKALGVGLLAFCLLLFGAGLIGKNNNPHSRYVTSRYGHRHRSSAFHSWRSTATGLAIAGPGLLVVGLLGLSLFHYRAVRRHERQQLFLGILTQGHGADRAKLELAAHDRRWKRAGRKVFVITGLSVLAGWPTVGVLFLFLLPAALRRSLEVHLEREQVRPVLGGADTEDPRLTYLDFTQTRELLGVDEATLNRLVAQGELRTHSRDGAVTFKNSEVAQYLS